jgi:hypothetical protein
MYKNSQTANNAFHLTLFNQEVELPVSVRMQDHHQVFTSELITKLYISYKLRPSLLQISMNVYLKDMNKTG